MSQLAGVRDHAKGSVIPDDGEMAAWKRQVQQAAARLELKDRRKGDVTPDDVKTQRRESLRIRRDLAKELTKITGHKVTPKEVKELASESSDE